MRVLRIVRHHHSLYVHSVLLIISEYVLQLSYWRVPIRTLIVPHRVKRREYWLSHYSQHLLVEPSRSVSSHDYQLKRPAKSNVVQDHLVRRPFDFNDFEDLRGWAYEEESERVLGHLVSNTHQVWHYVVALLIPKPICLWGPIRPEPLVLCVVARAESEVRVSLAKAEAFFGGDQKSNLTVFLADEEVPTLGVYHVLSRLISLNHKWKVLNYFRETHIA